ncbi:MAG: hypothetical protein ACPGOV_09950 [Magnetovibrionaceae bacterium]
MASFRVKNRSVASFCVAAALACGLYFSGAEVVQAQGAINALRIDVAVACTPDAAEFRVHNLGDGWPRTAEFQIMTIATQGVLSKRKLRLAEGQRASFKIKKTKGGADQLGLFIDPSWYVRSFQFDAIVDCRG